jgi:hypothetical protein
LGLIFFHAGGSGRRLPQRRYDFNVRRALVTCLLASPWLGVACGSFDGASPTNGLVDAGNEPVPTKEPVRDVEDARTVPDAASLACTLGPNDAGADADAADPRLLDAAVTDAGRSGVRCGEQCVDIARDAKNCGTCGNVCAATAACEGACVDIATRLPGALLIKQPCNSQGKAGDYCGASAGRREVAATLDGDKAKVFVLSLRVWGVVEEKDTAGGQPCGAVGQKSEYCRLGGQPNGDLWNAYTLGIEPPVPATDGGASGPARVVLNAGNSGHNYCAYMDYRFDLRVPGGARLLLTVSSNDSLQAPAFASSKEPIVPNGQYYNGQQVTVEVEGVRLEN